MARLLTSGAETGVFNSEGLTTSGSPTIVTTPVRTGGFSFNYGTTLGDHKFSFTGVLGRTYFLRAYVRATAFPAGSSTRIILFSVSTTKIASIILLANGTLALFNEITLATVGSVSSALSLNTWYRVELSCNVGTGTVDSLQGYLDGTSFASGTGLALSESALTKVEFGHMVTAPAGTTQTNMDDVALNDDQGANQNTWPGDGKVVLLLPISDNARAALWTGGAGDTTNLWDAVNNTPPIGTATETNLTQIEHAGSAAGTTDAYDANMTTPATAGITADDTINTAEFIEVDGEDIAIGSKLLNFEVLSNPVIASPGNVTAGANAGALGTYPTLWVARRSPPVYNPSVTVGTSPVMRARRPETASRVASVCFMGIYMDYTPGMPPGATVIAPVLGIRNAWWNQSRRT